MITYSSDVFADHIDELKELCKLHYKESCPYEDIPLNVKWDLMAKMNYHGYLKFFTVKKEGKLIGYATFSINTSMEYSDSLQASLGNIFLHPDHRGTGMKFIKWCDEQLKNTGVQVVYHHVKAKNDYGKLLKRLGYAIMNYEYAKRLDK